jgi:hypothetical protein
MAPWPSGPHLDAAVVVGREEELLVVREGHAADGGLVTLHACVHASVRMSDWIRLRGSVCMCACVCVRAHEARRCKVWRLVTLHACVHKGCGWVCMRARMRACDPHDEMNPHATPTHLPFLPHTTPSLQPALPNPTTNRRPRLACSTVSNWKLVPLHIWNSPLLAPVSSRRPSGVHCTWFTPARVCAGWGGWWWGGAGERERENVCMCVWGGGVGG